MANDMHTDGQDIGNGTYDAISPTAKELSGHLVRENPTLHESAQHGADVGSRPSPGTEDPISKGLLRERKGPLSAQTGRRPMD